MKKSFRFLNPGKLVDADLELVLSQTIPADPVKKYVPCYEFELRETGKPAKIGSIRLRIGRTRALTGWCGHIGYGVDEPARGRRYAARSCRLLFPLAYAHGLRTLWITCDPKNMASRRTCEIAGGEYIDTVRVPKGTELYAEGRRRVRRYRFDLARLLRSKRSVVTGKPMSFTIRRMTLADYEPVVALWRALPGIGLDDDSDSRAGIARYLKRNPGLSFVALAQGIVVGAVLSGHDGRRGYLHHLAVAPTHRKLGIGKALTLRCLEALGRNGIPKCNIFLYRSNAEGRAFWKHHDWDLRQDLSVMQKKTSAGQ
jgi:N-acetylglutamate synthase